MDILEIEPKDHSFELVHPATDEPLKIHIHLQPMSAPAVKRVERRMRDEALRIRSKGKIIKTEQQEAWRADLLVAAVTGWTWENEDLTLDGQKNPPFNEKNLRSLLAKSWPADQIDIELGEVKNFFKD